MPKEKCWICGKETEIKVLLEIDGESHKYTKKKDVKRSAEIKREKPNWEIVRIKTSYLEENPMMLVNAIKEILKDRKMKPKIKATYPKKSS